MIYAPSLGGLRLRPLGAAGSKPRRAPAAALPPVSAAGAPLAVLAIHRLVHRCEIFWNESRVQPYSRSRVTVGREGISRVPRRSLAPW